MYYAIMAEDVPQSLDKRLAARPDHLARLIRRRRDDRQPGGRRLEDFDFILARAEIDFRAEATLGDELIVEALGKAPNCPSRLSGPARIVAEIEPDASWLQG